MRRGVIVSSGCFRAGREGTRKTARLTARKIVQTKEKQDRLGARDEDDYGLVLPPETFKVNLALSRLGNDVHCS